MAVYKRGYRRYSGPLTGRWTRFMVLPRYAWRRLYQQRLVLLLTMLAFVWPSCAPASSISPITRSCCRGSSASFASSSRSTASSSRSSCTSRRASRSSSRHWPGRPDCAGSGEQRAPALLQPASHALELRPRPAGGSRRNAVGRHVDSGPASLRVAGRTCRKLVVLGELDARCRRGCRVSPVAAGPQPGGDGQFRVREVEGGGGCGQPGLLLHTERHRRDDQRRLARHLGARHRSGLVGQPCVVRLLGVDPAARRPRCGAVMLALAAMVLLLVLVIERKLRPVEVVS
jgi:hypothetical protein